MKKILSFDPKPFFNSKRLLATLTLISISFSSIIAQSGTALSFDGTDDRVDLPNILTASYTKEAWVYAPLDNAAVNNNNVVSGTATAFWFPGNQGFRLSAGHAASGFTAVQDPTPLVANTWTHVAVTYNSATTTMNLYKNGVLVDSDNTIGTHAESTLHIGAYLAANYMKGIIDEVRIWSVALTQAEIRDWMVVKATASHPQWANLIAYYKADDGSGTNLNDSKNNNDGTLVNGTAWVTSGAPLGDASVHDYVNATKTASITHPGSGESLSATSSGGSPDAIHVYRVDMAPTNKTGTTGLGGNNKYFGVFQVGGTAPTFTSVYTFTANTVESALILYERINNSTASWTNSGATLNEAANTLTVTGETSISMEYVLGSTNFPLPVQFVNFDAAKEKNGVRLSWSTATEANNKGFVIQRSTNGNNWEDLSFVTGRNRSGQSYSFLDVNPAKGLNYFRLKQVDEDGSYTLSEVRTINFLKKGGINLYPIPASDAIVIDFEKESLVNTEAKLLNANGVLIKKFIIKSLQERLSVSSLARGIYMIELADGSVHKFVKQ